METIRVTKNDLKELKVIYPKNAELTTKRSAELIAERISKRSGIEIPAADNWDFGKINLIVGNIWTERAKNLCLPLDHNRYGTFVDISEQSTDIYLSGGDEYAVWRAAHDFYAHCIGQDGSLTLAEKDLGVVDPLFVRDPFILKKGDVYYIYKNFNNRYWVSYQSRDLIHWSDFKVVMDPEDQPPEFDAESDLWAPEVHEYHGKYYMFATYRKKGAVKHEESGHYYRGCCILRSDTPDGKFKLITNGLIVPQNHMFVDGKWVEDGAESWSCIDATLYVDENDDPWIAFSHEWVSTMPHGGYFCAARLNHDLTDIEGEVHTLFNTYDGYQSNEAVTDAVYFYRTQSGQLLLLWSNFDFERGKGYRVYIARSRSGNILGPWTHDKVYLYEKDMDCIYTLYDGGHPCITYDLNGKMLLCIHSPSTHHESDHLIPIKEENDTLVIDRDR